MSADERFVPVTKEAFFAVIGPMDVHPRPEPDRSVWETPRRRVVGITTPGYKCEGEKTYRLLSELAATPRSAS